MKRIGLLLTLLCFTLLLFAQATVSKIVVNNENRIVSRVVITLSDNADWTFDDDVASRSVTVTIDNTNTTTAKISGLEANSLISGIETGRGGIIEINLRNKFFIETMNLDNPHRIIIDLFVAKAYTLEEYYLQASFYENVGKYAAAAKEYDKMLKKFPSGKDTHYYYGLLLLKQNSKTKAKQHFEAVPASSGFYSEAQAKLVSLGGKATPKTATENKTPAKPEPAKTDLKKPPMAKPAVPQPTKPIVLPPDKPVKSDTSKPKTQDPIVQEMEDAIAMAESSAYNDIAKIDTVYDEAIPVPGKLKKTTAGPGNSVWSKITNLPIWLWVIILLILLTIFFIFLDTRHTRRPARKRSDEPRNILKLDDSTKCRMVSKLLADGWDASEIARELRISRSDVNLYIKQCQMSGFDNEEK